MQRANTWHIFTFLILLSLSFPAGAQGLGSSDNDELEALYDTLDEKQESKEKRRTTRRRKKKKAIKIEKLHELSTLAPFSDVAVITKKYLPKTERFELNAAGMLGLNNRYFNNLGLALRAGYFFSEKYGVEASYTFLTDAEKDVTTTLREDIQIETASLVSPKSHMGINFKWSPIYGKMAVFDDKIVSYDMIFSLGYGMTETALESGVPTLGLGVGQLFAVGKSMAFRWDVVWNQYSAKVKQKDKNGDLQESTLSQSDLFLAVGVSYFLPDAGYR